jgi:hypothetical protein
MNRQLLIHHRPQIANARRIDETGWDYKGLETGSARCILPNDDDSLFDLLVTP